MISNCLRFGQNKAFSIYIRSKLAVLWPDLQLGGAEGDEDGEGVGIGDVDGEVGRCGSQTWRNVKCLARGKTQTDRETDKRTVVH